MNVEPHSLGMATKVPYVTMVSDSNRTVVIHYSQNNGNLWPYDFIQECVLLWWVAINH